MNYDEALSWLFSQLPMFSRVGAAAYKPGLQTAETLDAVFGHPHRRFKSIHIGGTNGKGSTSHMLASILQAQGYKTALYTSPHLVDFRERIRVNGRMIPREAVVDFVERWQRTPYDGHPSFFELTMMMAFDHFAKEDVDYAVIEVGMGGRLDSTNIISPIATVITNISKDHTQFLGSTLPEIAAEKAGIIKPGIPVVIGNPGIPEVREVFQKAADRAGVTPDFASDHPLPTGWHPLPQGGWQFQLPDPSPSQKAASAPDPTGVLPGATSAAVQSLSPIALQCGASAPDPTGVLPGATSAAVQSLSPIALQCGASAPDPTGVIPGAALAAVQSLSPITLQCAASAPDPTGVIPGGASAPDLFQVPLGGEYQKENINTVLHAVQMLREAGVEISDEAIRQGLAEVTAATGLMGRWMHLSDHPLVIADTGHNIDGLRHNLTQLQSLLQAPSVTALRAEARSSDPFLPAAASAALQSPPAPTKQPWSARSKDAPAPTKQPWSARSKDAPAPSLRFVIGFVADKAIDEILDLLPKDAYYYVTQAAIPRALPAEELSARFAAKGLPHETVTPAPEAYRRALAATRPNDILYVGGSTFVVADVLASLQP